MGDPLILRRLALDMIKINNYPKAKLALVKSLSLDSTLHDTYTLLGDVSYLENKRKEAITYYLAATHLLISSSLSNASEEKLKITFDSMPHTLKKDLPSKHALCLLSEHTISYHLGHALVDLDKPKTCFEKVFKELLISRLTLDSILSRHHIKANDYLEYRNSILIPLGREYLIKNIHWNLIYSTDVELIYFSKEHK